MKLFGTPPSLSDLQGIARETYASIPMELRRCTQDLAIRVEDFPDDDVIEDMGLESPFDLLGLYQGIDLTSKSVMDVPQEVDMVYLFRRPILDYWCEAEEDLAQIIRHVLIHEIGHHFGFSDEDMERIEQSG